MPGTHLSLGMAAALFATCAIARGEESTYLKPREEILRVLHAPDLPDGFLSPHRDTLVLADPVAHPPISYFSQTLLPLAGVRVMPRNRGLAEAYANGESYWSSFTLVDLPDGRETPVDLPKDAKIGRVIWSGDGRHFAFSRIADSSIELWLGQKGDRHLRKVPGIRLNRMLENGVRWLPDGLNLLVKTIPDYLGAAPHPGAGAIGPEVQEASGEKGPSSTYEVRDVLKSPQDERLFDYYGLSQLKIVNSATLQTTAFGKPGLYAQLLPSPDGRYVLVGTVHRPYSHVTTYHRFPQLLELWDRHAQVVRKIADLPLADAVPIWGVPTGPRDFKWNPTKPALLFWAEALDGGDWNQKAPFRDKLMSLSAPFTGEAKETLRLASRLESLAFGQGGLAVVEERDPILHWTKARSYDLDQPGSTPGLIWDRSTDERYLNPGRPVYKTLANGFFALEQEGDAIFLSGEGASTSGDRPFLDRFNLKTHATERLFRSDEKSYERFLAWMDLPTHRFITSRESPLDPPNYTVRALGQKIEAISGEAVWNSQQTFLTHLADPLPLLRKIRKQLVRYKRKDGVDLSFQLFLPPDYVEGTRLPALLWAYPLDYADPRMAGQITGSTQHFTQMDPNLQLYFLLDGYAVIDNPQMPVVGDSNKIYDTYMEQLTADAEAAVDAAVKLGIVDRDRIGVMGHSHGGLMTANLLAHTSLFRAGIARSGAYNRTLTTAFGFQSERRTLWQAPEVYENVSPFFHADKIKTPLLLIHGQADANPGTLSLQSEQFYQAVRGNGGTVRLVMLPYESHWYKAMESNEHVLAEMLSWFDRYVKPVKVK